MALPVKVVGLTLTQVRRSTDQRVGVRLEFAYQEGVTGYIGTQSGPGATPTTEPYSFSIPQGDDHHATPPSIVFDHYGGGLTEGTFTFTVAAVNADGTGPKSDPATITFTAPPALTNVVTSEIIRSDGKVGVQFEFDYQNDVSGYRFTRQDAQGPVTYTFPQPALAPSNRRLIYRDFYVTSPGTYAYTIRAVNGTILGVSSDHTQALTAEDGGVIGDVVGGDPSYTGGLRNPGVVRWVFRDVWGRGGGGGSGETETAVLLRLRDEVRSGIKDLNRIRADVDRLAYGDETTHFEPLPVPPERDYEHLMTDAKLVSRIREIYNNRGVPISTAVSGGTLYVFEINPNEGGSPAIQKNIAVATNVGPNRGAILQEGQNTAPILSFSGLIITQTHYEALETWFDKKVLLELTDDLGRTFRGVFSAFDPTRIRKPFNPWYHSYTAQFTCFGYKNASGQIRYGRF